MVYSNKKQTKGASQKVSIKKNDYKNRKRDSVSRGMSKKRNLKKNKSKRSLRKKKGGANSNLNLIHLIGQMSRLLDNVVSFNSSSDISLEKKKELYLRFLQFEDKHLGNIINRPIIKPRLEEIKPDVITFLTELKQDNLQEYCSYLPSLKKIFNLDTEIDNNSCTEKKDSQEAEIQDTEKTCSEPVKKAKSEAEQQCKKDSEAACQQSLTEAQEGHLKEMEKKKEGLSKIFEGLIDATCESMGREHCTGFRPEMNFLDKFEKVMKSITFSFNSCKQLGRNRERVIQQLRNLIKRQGEFAQERQEEIKSQEQEKQKRESDIKKATKLLEKYLDLNNEQDLKYEHVLGEEIEKTERLEETGEIKKVQKCSNDSVIECELLDKLYGGKSLEPILLVRNNDGSLSLRKGYEGEIVKIESGKINFMLPVKIKYPEERTISGDNFLGLHGREIEERPSQLLIINSSSKDGNFVSNYFIMNEAMSPFLKEFLKKKNKVFVGGITLDEDIRKLIHGGVVPVNVELILERIKQHRENFSDDNELVQNVLKATTDADNLMSGRQVPSSVIGRSRPKNLYPPSSSGTF